MKIRYLLNNLGDRIPPQSPNSLGESGTPPPNIEKIQNFSEPITQSLRELFCTFLPGWK